MNLINEIATWNYVRGNTELDLMLAHDMLLEELTEFKDATTPTDQADALGDLAFVALGELYKLSGSSVRAQLIMEAIVTANFAKGSKKNSAGKIVKPKDFVGPEEKITQILKEDLSLWGTYLEDNEHIYKGV